jgi:hypothetical protein
MFIRYLCYSKKISFEEEGEDKELSLKSSKVKNTCLKYRLSIGQYFDFKNAINKRVVCDDEELSYFFDDLQKKGFCISDKTKRFLYINIIALSITNTNNTNNTNNINI